MRIPASNWHVKECVGETECSAGERASLMPDRIMEGECEPVQLEPFVHQVGGHSSMLLFDDTTLCKPLISRELKFYETLPKGLRKVTPQYRGTIEVSFQEDSAGYLSLVANTTDCRRSPQNGSPHESPRASLHPSPPDSPTGSPRHSLRGSPNRSTGSHEGSPNSSADNINADSDSESTGARALSVQRFRMQKSGSIEIEGLSEKLQASIEKTKREKQIISAPGLNPWSLRCHREQLAKMRKSSRHPHYFILLENLASQFPLPCILDLKMGQRQHGDDVSEDKKARHIRRCQESTSQQLGFRICGMQVYQADTGHFLCHNKYYGRRLDVEGVRESLRQFLHNGERMRIPLVDGILEKLKRLYDTLKKQNTFRFYSSSLLVMYDGTDDDDQDDDLISSDYVTNEHKVASSSSGTDNASQARCKSTPNPCTHTDPVSGLDESYHNALPTEGGLVNGHDDGTKGDNLPPTCELCRHNADYNNSLTRSSSAPGVHSSTLPHSQSNSQVAMGSRSNAHHTAPNGKNVDVRMIDFAHATHSGFEHDETRHEGPDHGYLFGLKNLMQMFRELKEEYCSSGPDG